MDDFNVPKITWAETMRIRRDSKERFPRFSYVEKSFYTDKTCFIAVASRPFLILALLNSLIGRYQLSQTVSMMDNGGYLMQKIYIETLKVPESNPEIESKITLLVERLLDKTLSFEKREDVEKEIDHLIFLLFKITSLEQEYLFALLSKQLGKRTTK
jgi:hypothetical protein